MPTPAPKPTKTAELSPRLAQSIEEVRRRLAADAPRQPHIAVLGELEKIMDPSIAEVLKQIREYLEAA